VQRLRRLLHSRRARLAERCFVVEGEKLIAVALARGCAIESLYHSPRLSDSEAGLLRRGAEAGIRVFELEAGVLERVSDTTTPQGVCAVVGFLDLALCELLSRSADRALPGDRDRLPLVLVCVDVRDPGNFGAVLRSAEAAGVTGVVACEGTVDPYNPKAVRASAGALFDLPLAVGEPVLSALCALAAAGYTRLGTAARGGAPYLSVHLDGPVALVLGNEAAGLAEAVAVELDGLVTVPMAGNAESLNVAMVATILCFEAARQRGSGSAERVPCASGSAVAASRPA
jgi:TrmH family RNA methyltransferase